MVDKFVKIQFRIFLFDTVDSLQRGENKTCCHVQAFGHRVGRVPVGIQVTKPVLGFATVDSNILATLHFLPAVIFIFEMKFI